MTLLIIGLIIWTAAHFFKRIAPEMRARMGSKGRVLIALCLLASVVLMSRGYGMADMIPLYTPLPGIGYLNNLMMLLAVFFIGISSTKGVLVDKIRHPMLWGTIIFAIAHLLVNGDLASVVLFGGLGLWAVAEMLLINRTAGKWDRPAPGTLKGDIKNGIITLVLFAIIASIHIWQGYNPFQGTYG
ncbi:NnrU family protein in cluster with Mesaconyl-CoA hydratase [hydrothermal vent metagenome]|uniref:NnrU family protein in cluster with Mesaconyl-CoA hydratase n=1 Tax=hydrothermal vent metagenome TaxID=652676 RepID=A0A3B0RME6_9ZZZZ